MQETNVLSLRVAIRRYPTNEAFEFEVPKTRLPQYEIGTSNSPH